MPICHICGAAGTELYRDLRDKLFGAPGTWVLKQCSEWSCGLVWLDPMPLQDDIGIAYSGYYTHSNAVGFSPTWPERSTDRAFLATEFGYPLSADITNTRLRSILAKFKPHRTAQLEFDVMYLPFIPDGRLLEVGCGNGFMLELMLRLGWRAEGVDFDAEAVAAARARGLRVQVGSLEDQSYPDNIFDAVTMSHLIEHVPDPIATINEVRRILKPGGKLVVVTPNSASLGRAIFGRSWRGLEPPRHLHIFNPESLQRLALAGGLTVEKLHTTIRAANGMFAASIALRKKGVRYAPPSDSLPSLIFTRLMQLFEWLYLKFRPHAGEEVMLIARKD